MSSQSHVAGRGSRPHFVPAFFVQAVLAALREERVDLVLLQRSRSLAAHGGQTVSLVGAAHAEGAALSLTGPDYLALLDEARTITGNPALGLLVGQRITEANLHMLGPIIVASRTLRAALEHLAAVQTALYGRAFWALEELDEYAFYGPTYAASSPVVAELSLAVAFCCAQRFVGLQHGSALDAQLPFPAPEQLEPYRRLFGERVEFGTGRTGLRMPRALLDVARPGTDPTLASTLRQLALERFTTSGEAGSWAERVEQALREHAQLVHVDLAAIAARWQLSARSLRRRLELEGTRLLDVLNRARYERARQQLDQTQAPIAEVADALGYSDVSAFQRAFKSWAGVSPAQYRERALGLRNC